MTKQTIKTVALLMIGLVLAASAKAEDTLKLAIGQRGNWENAPAHLGQEAGIFKKHGLNLDILYTQGGGETMQAVISGSVDVGVGVGLLGTMGAFSKGAPLRAIANSATGANDLYWYVRSESPIKKIADAKDQTIAFSSNGSSTNITVLGFIREFGLNATPVATGNPASTLTQVMSGQVDVGWASPPFGVKEVDENKIRIVGRGNDVPSLRNQTLRVMITNVSTLEQRGEVIERYVKAYGEVLDWMYSDPAALEAYAKWVGIPVETAQRVKDEFYPKENLRINRLSGLEEAQKDGVDFKFIAQPLTADQTSQLFHYPGGHAE